MRLAAIVEGEWVEPEKLDELKKTYSVSRARLVEMEQEKSLLEQVLKDCKREYFEAGGNPAELEGI